VQANVSQPAPVVSVVAQPTAVELLGAGISVHAPPFLWYSTATPSQWYSRSWRSQYVRFAVVAPIVSPGVCISAQTSVL
jgi:hypothetical protein